MAYLGNSLQAAYSSYQVIDSLTASFNGSTTSFPLRVNGITPVPFPLNEQNVLISVGGVPQKPDPTGAEGFKFSGSNIVFSSAPKTGEAFWGVVLAGADYVSAGAIYPDGTAANPGMVFTSDRTTGFYRYGAGQVGLGVNGATPLVFGTSGIQFNGATSGYTILSAPAAGGNNTITLPTSNGSAYQILRNGATAGTTEFADKIVSGTAQASTSGTAIDFTGIPSWAKRITVMFNGVSTNGASAVQVQLGSGSFAVTGYASSAAIAGGASYAAGLQSTTGFLLTPARSASDVTYGVMTVQNVSGNTWVSSTASGVNNAFGNFGGGSVTLSGTLDRVRITTVNGTDAFDAGSINILYE